MNNDMPSMFIPEINSFDKITEKARERVASKGKCRAAYLKPMDKLSFEAFKEAQKQGLIEPVELSNEGQKGVAEAARKADQGEIDLIVRGRVEMSDMLSTLFKHENDFIVKNQMVSHVAVMKPAKYPKLLLLTDSAVVVQPDLKKKMNLIGNLVKFSEAIGIIQPRIAILAAVEVVYPQMPVTTEAAILAKMAERGQIKGAHVDGPLSFDVAVDMVAAHAKGITNSEVAGQADALLAPNIEVANGVYKAMVLYGNCDIGGVIVGGKVPITIGSHSDTRSGNFNSIILGLLGCQ